MPAKNEVNNAIMESNVVIKAKTNLQSNNLAKNVVYQQFVHHDTLNRFQQTISVYFVLKMEDQTVDEDFIVQAKSVGKDAEELIYLLLVTV